MQLFKQLYLILIYWTLLLPEIAAQQAPAGTISTGLYFDFQHTKERYSKEAGYHFNSDFSFDYFLINNFGLGAFAGLQLTDGSHNYYYGPYAKWFIFKGLFIRAGYKINSVTAMAHSVPLSLGYAAIFQSGFSIEPIFTYDISLKKDIPASLSLGIGARYYFKKKN